VLIDALPRLIDRVPAARVVIAGFGPLHAELVERAARLGVGDRVLVPGDVAEANLLHNCFDVYVLPSLAESTPLVVLEAIACRVPVVATAVGDVPALLDQGRAGVLVPPGDPGALADGLARVLTEPGFRERLAAAAWDHVSREYSAASFVERHAELYRKLLDRRRRATAGAAPADERRLNPARGRR
jgi:glycosyltransferase involved in cell wall biosynthesis